MASEYIDDTENGSGLYPTKIPGYEDAADIQEALKLYHYGSTVLPTVDQLNVADGINSKSIAGYIRLLKDADSANATIAQNGLNLEIQDREDADTNLQIQINNISSTLAAQTAIVTKTESFALELEDVGKMIALNASSPMILTIPANSDVLIPIGYQYNLLEIGISQTTFSAGSGVLINSKNSQMFIDSRYGKATLLKIGTDNWVLFGDIAEESVVTPTPTPTPTPVAPTPVAPTPVAPTPTPPPVESYNIYVTCNGFSGAYSGAYGTAPTGSGLSSTTGTTSTLGLTSQEIISLLGIPSACATGPTPVPPPPTPIPAPIPAPIITFEDYCNGEDIYRRTFTNGVLTSNVLLIANSLSCGGSGTPTPIPAPFFPPIPAPFFPPIPAPFFPPIPAPTPTPIPGPFFPPIPAPFFPPIPAPIPAPIAPAIVIIPYFGPPCVEENTLVDTVDGPVPAKFLSVGDELISVALNELDENNPDYQKYTWSASSLTSSGLQTTTITNITASEDSDILVFNKEFDIKMTFTQPVFVKDAQTGIYRIKEAYYVEIGDSLIMFNSSGVKTEIEVTDVDYITDEVVTVYEFSCEPYDWFFLSGMLVHNK